MTLSVLAVSVSSGRAGFVLVQEGTVQDWGASERMARRQDDLRTFLRGLIAGYQPDVVATEAIGKGCLKHATTKALIAALAHEAAQHELLDVSVPMPRKHPSKYERAVSLTERHPALAGYLPRRRPYFYENTPRGYLLFDAVALAEAALAGPEDKG